jgi:ABC-type transport system substrate-binding protein
MAEAVAGAGAAPQDAGEPESPHARDTPTPPACRDPRSPFAGRAFAGGRPGARTLRFVPQSDVTVLDPLWSTAFVSRNHAYLVYDTLYGTDANYQPQPQMAEGHVVEDGGLPGPSRCARTCAFHDGEPVRAADAVASIRRWGARDGFGQALLAATDELSALDDRRLRFRLKKPFPLLPAALGKTTVTVPFIMPERLARTDAATQVSEIVGSGPYRFVRMSAWPGAHRLQPLRRLCPARGRHAFLHGRAEGGASRPRRMDRHARRRHRLSRAARPARWIGGSRPAPTSFPCCAATGRSR